MKLNHNAETLAGLIRTSLHIQYEHTKAAGHKAILDHADALRTALSPLYPVSDKEWELVQRDIARYADCLL